MVNPFHDVNWRPGTVERRKFARSLMIGFPVLAILLLVAGWISKGTLAFKFPLLMGAIGLAAGALLWAVPAIALPFYLIWYGAACCIGLVLTNVLLTLFYYLAVTSFGWLRRTLGRPGLRRGVDRSAPTYWKQSEKVADPGRYYSQF